MLEVCLSLFICLDSWSDFFLDTVVDGHDMYNYLVLLHPVSIVNYLNLSSLSLGVSLHINSHLGMGNKPAMWIHMD